MNPEQQAQPQPENLTSNTPPPGQVTRHEPHTWYWVLILLLLGLGLATVMFFVYKKSVDEYVADTTRESTAAEEPAPSESSESSGSVEQDQTMQEDEVTDEIMLEIQDVEGTDASAKFDESGMSDLQ